MPTLGNGVGWRWCANSALSVSASGAGTGIDERPVQVERRRQSVSVEQTFDRDLPDLAACEAQLAELLAQLERRIARLEADYRPGKPFVKLKFHDFTQTTVEQVGVGATLEGFTSCWRAPTPAADGPCG